MKAPDGPAILTARVESPLGPLTVGAVDAGICLIAFPPRSAEAPLAAPARHTTEVAVGDHPHLARMARELSEYFAGRLTQFTPPLVPSGTPFQQRVWQQLLQIPYGHTWSYEQLAQATGVEHGQRAVGHANGSNPIAIVIPCHRVINKNGRLGGYGGELWRKQALLALEGGHPMLGLAS